MTDQHGKSWRCWISSFKMRDAKVLSGKLMSSMSLSFSIASIIIIIIISTTTVSPPLTHHILLLAFSCLLFFAPHIIQGNFLFKKTTTTFLPSSLPVWLHIFLYNMYGWMNSRWSFFFLVLHITHSHSTSPPLSSLKTYIKYYLTLTHLMALTTTCSIADDENFLLWKILGTLHSLRSFSISFTSTCSLLFFAFTYGHWCVSHFLQPVISAIVL